tara:strand:- start:187 stop:834 length:648 start_codon:yes stop_codon:yes gene_type:complete
MKSNKNSINLFSFLIFIAIALIVIITILLVLRTTNEHFDNHAPSVTDNTPSSSNNNGNEEMNSNNNYNNQEAEDPIEMENAFQNFMRYPGLQMFCTVLKGNLASMWGKLPESIGNGLYVKTCCPMCYENISKSLCTNSGEYTISKMTADDVNNIKAYHINNNLDFELDEDTLNGLINSDILKMSENNYSFPVQVLMKAEDISQDDFINNSLNYKC